jgi:WD40 repeat protein
VTDGTVWLWSTGARPALLTTLTGPAGHVYSVAFRPGGRALAAASADGTVRLWATRPDAAAEAVCATAGQPLTRPEWDTYVPGLAYQPRPAADGLTRPHLRLTGRPPGRRLPPRRLRNASIQLMK